MAFIKKTLALSLILATLLALGCQTGRGGGQETQGRTGSGATGSGATGTGGSGGTTGGGMSR